MQLQVRYISIEEIEKIIEYYFIQFYPHRKIPIDIDLIVEKMGVNIIPVSELYNLCGIEAAFCFYKGKESIIIDNERFMNDNDSPRARFSFSHELGHYVLHKDAYKLININKIGDYYNIFQKVIPPSVHKRLEFQANEFAGRFLMPTIELKKAFNNLYKEMLENDNVDMSTVYINLSSYFNVSLDAIRIRISKENLNSYLNDYIY
jgi:Zn-dependent peptidase ImmA (M78 family)